MWEYVIGGATIFGAIVAFGAWLNGRLTRRYIAQLILQESAATRELLGRMNQQLELMRGYLERMDSKLDLLLERTAQR